MPEPDYREAFKGLPPPNGRNCPEHPTYPLVVKPEGLWCRAGQHYVEQDAEIEKDPPATL